MVFSLNESRKISIGDNFDRLDRHESVRKSAVELLAETKAYYVKSKCVRDQKQVLPIRSLVSSQSYQVKNSAHSSIHHILPSGVNYLNSVEVSPSKSLPLVKVNRRSTPVNSDVLQMKLRQLINSEMGNFVDDSITVRENDVISPPAEYAAKSPSYCLKNRHSQSNAIVHKSLPNLNCDTNPPDCLKNTGLSSTLKDSFDDSSGHFTQPSADNSIGSLSTRSNTQKNHPQRQYTYGRDSGSSTQHSDKSLNKKSFHFGDSFQQKSSIESQIDPYSRMMSLLKFNEPHPSKLWSRSAVKSVPENRLNYDSRKIITPVTKSEKDDLSRPILRSKSDISDRYGRDSCVSLNSIRSDLSLNDINYFFDYMGMGKDIFEEVLSSGAKNSKSNFIKNYRNSDDNNSGSDSGHHNNSDVSSVESSSSNYRLCDFEDRNIETVSIVERNARIIKWLCNCRKSQMALLSRNASLV